MNPGNAGNQGNAGIVIPADLLPRDGRFGSGPGKVQTQFVAALADAAKGYLGTSHRQPTVRSVVARVRHGLGDLFNLPDGYEVLLGNGGSTTFWDAASFGLVERRAQHVVIGEFSQKFATVNAAAPHLDQPEVISTEPGLTPTPCRADAEIDTYCFPHNETSTGVMMDVVRPEGAGPSPPGGIVLVDATSGAGGLRVDPTQFDVYYFAPQKCFGGDGGMWLALVSPAAIERVEKLAASDRWRPASLDLGIALEQSRLDQTYNTLALSTIFLLALQVEWMLANGGLEGMAARTDASADTLYGWAGQHPLVTPFVADPRHRSRVTATLDFDMTVDAATLAKTLRANGILDTEPYRKLGRNQLRIAMFPNIDPDDIERLTRCLDYVLERSVPA
jgi:phosphoserine aminotransferase